MSNVFQSITNSVFGSSDPTGLYSSLCVLYKNSTAADRVLLDDPSSLPGLELTRALQVVVDRNDVPCIMLLFSKERATYILDTEKSTSAKHKKGLKLLSRLRDVLDPVFTELFNAILQSNSSHDVTQSVNVFVADLQHALDSRTQRNKINDKIQSTAAPNAHKKL